MSKIFWAYLFCSLLFLGLHIVNAQNVTSSPSSSVDTTSISSETSGSDTPSSTNDDATSTAIKPDTSESITSSPAGTTTPVISDAPSSPPSSSESDVSSPASAETSTIPSDENTTTASSEDDTSSSTNTDESSVSAVTSSESTDSTQSTITDDISSSTNTDETSISPVTSSESTDSTQSTIITELPPYHVKQRTSFTWRSTNMDQNPIVFEVEEGYFISVNVSNVEMSNGNYLLIAGGDSYSEDATDGRVFANSVKGPLAYLFKTSKVFAFCENTVVDGENPVTYEFTVLFEQVGELTTTTVVTTTTPITIPPTKPEEPMYITVNVSGKSLSEYNDTNVRQTFQGCVATMAINYCEDKNIILTKNITSEYVILREIAQCPYKWQNTNDCVKITFSLPIFYEGSSDSYKLSTKELEMMWLRWEELDDQCFHNNGFSVYEEPDVDRAIVWWAVGISLTTIFFIILLWFLRMFGTRVRRAIKRKYNGGASDTESILIRDSISSLSPHYLQDTPKLFEN